MNLHKNVKKIIAIFKQNYSLKLFIAFKMAYSCCFLDFWDFPPKIFFL